MSKASAKQGRTLSRFVPSVFGVAVCSVHVLAICAILFVVCAQHQAAVRQAALEGREREFILLAQSLVHEDGQVEPNVHERLEQFNSDDVWIGLRLVNAQGNIISSIREEEVGTRHLIGQRLASTWPEVSVTERNPENPGPSGGVTIRAPVPGLVSADKVLLEGVTRLDLLAPQVGQLQGTPWMIIAGSLALLVALCWWVRRTFQPLANIGSNLVAHRQFLREELSSLRLASESGAVAKSWNQLIKLFEELHDFAGQASAYRELNSALERSGTTGLSEALDTIPEGIVHILDGKRLGFANSIARRLLGLGGAKYVEPHAADFFDLGTTPLGSKIVDAVKSARNGSVFEARTATLGWDNDTTFRVRVLPVVRKSHGAEAIVLISDVSQQAKAESAREKFVAHVAHELRTPLTNIQAYAETLAEFDDPEVQTECFNVINKETRRLARLVEEMLSRSQLDLGTIQIRRNNVDLLVLLNEAVRDLKATAEIKSIELSAKLPSKVPNLLADRDKLAIVVNNLLGNALKYTPNEGKVSVACSVEADHICIAVGDTGIGVRPEDREKIFEPMFRADTPEVRHETGTGIGLTTARDIARAHGGDITVTSEIGKGSTFTIRIPLQQATVG